MALFVVLALVPICTLALITYLSVNRELVALSEERLKSQVKSQTMAILERLALLDGELALLAANGSVEAPAPIPEALRRPIALRFRRLSWVGSTLERPMLGGAVDPPSLSIEQRLRLAGGHTLLVLDHRQNDPRFLLARAAPTEGGGGRGELWGEIDPGYLWWGVPRENHLPTLTEMCVVEPASGRTLICSSGEPAKLGADLWTRMDQEALGEAYGHAGFTVILSEAQARLSGPLRDFRRSFLPIVVTTLLLVMFLSIRQIRGSLRPLDRLRLGTRDIAERNFTARVEIESGDEFQELAESFNRMARRLGAQFEALSSLTEIQRAVLSAEGRREVAYAVLTRLECLLPCRGAQLTLLHAPEPHATTYKWRPERSEEVVEELLHAEDLWWLQETDELKVIGSDEWLPSFIGSLRRGPVDDVAVVPVILEAKTIGVLAIGLAQGTALGAEELNPVRQLGGQIAQAFSQAALIEKLEELSVGTLAALARTIDANSKWTHGHSERVTKLAMRLGRKLGLSKEDLDTLERGALLHDIGKLGVPASILDKPEKLTEEERSRIQQHVEIGALILEPVPSLADTLPLVRQHHEWFDGTGYLEGLAGEEIHPLARLLSVVDAYDALRSPRPYRGAVSEHAVRVHLRVQAGSQFDPQMVEAFLKLLEEGDAELDRPTEGPQAQIG